MNGQTCRTKFRKISKRFLELSFFQRWCHAIFVSEKHRVMAGPSCSTILNRRGRKAIFDLQRRSSMAQRKALGRGLSALLGTPDLETDQLTEIGVDRILPSSLQPRKRF